MNVLTALVVCVHGFAALTTAPSAHIEHIVIGLGFAGAELATMLARDGKQFVAFEARETYGGRAQAVQVGDIRVGAGASWQRGVGEAHPLTERLRLCEMRSREQDWDSWMDYRSNGVEADVPWDAWEAAWDCAAVIARHEREAGRAELPLDVALKLCGWLPRKQEHFLAEAGSMDGALAEPTALGRLGSVPQATYTAPHEDNDRYILDERGFEELVGCWLDYHLSTESTRGRISARLNYASPVVNVNTALRRLTLANGTVYSFDTLFDTRSLAVLRWNAVREGGSAYSPPVSGERLRGLLSLHFPLEMRVFFRFPKKFWSGAQFFNIMSRSGLTGVLWHSLDHKDAFPGSRVIYATIHGAAAERFEAMSDARVTEALGEDLRAVFGKEALEPTSVRVTRWLEDEWFRGASLRLRLGATTYLDAVRAPLGGGTVHWAGEIQCPEMAGTAHGAILGAQTVYDAWKLAKGEEALVRAWPSDNKCFVERPANPVGNTGTPESKAREKARRQLELDELSGGRGRGGTSGGGGRKSAARRKQMQAATGNGDSTDERQRSPRLRHTQGAKRPRVTVKVYFEEVDRRVRRALERLDVADPEPAPGAAKLGGSGASSDPPAKRRRS